jgi:RNA polymerase sigma factor (sigma-70 family)
MDYNSLTDHELVDRIIINNDFDAAAYLLINRCSKIIRYLAEVKFRSLDIKPEELISELFIYLTENDCRRLRTWKGPDNFKAWIGVVITRYCLADIKKKENQPLEPLNSIELEDCAVTNSKTVTNSMELVEAISKLKNRRERLVLLMYEIQGRDVKEVAHILKTTPGNIHLINCRAKKNLRDLLKEGENNV